jgi:sugar O-acyltransferase (sialic acid O-acetyltransferase NeuD family)
MKIFNVLGNAKNYLPVIFDIVEDVYGKSKFFIFHNLDLIEHPDLVIKNTQYNYTLKDNKLIEELINCEFIFGVNGPLAKEKVFDFFSKKINRSNYISLIHPTAHKSKSSIISNGVIIEPNCVISSQTFIDFGVNIKRNTSVGHHGIIEKYVEVNPGVTVSSNVILGEKSIIGSGSVIKDGIRIGKNSLIGIGSVVTKDIPDGVIAYGNPCKVIKDNV